MPFKCYYVRITNSFIAESSNVSSLPKLCFVLFLKPDFDICHNQAVIRICLHASWKVRHCCTDRRCPLSSDQYHFNHVSCFSVIRSPCERGRLPTITSIFDCPLARRHSPLRRWCVLSSQQYVTLRVALYFEFESAFTLTQWFLLYFYFDNDLSCRFCCPVSSPMKAHCVEI